MKATGLRWISLGLFILLLIAMTIHSAEPIGLNVSWKNGDYSFTGGAPPWSLVFGIVIAILYVALTQSKTTESLRPMPDLFRRWLAGLVDWVLALVGWAPFPGLVAVLLEYRRTGEFAWTIDRQEYASGDWLISVVGVLGLMFVVMPAYFVICWIRGKPTPGACIFGYRIVQDEDERTTVWMAYLRALLGAVALLGWPSWILAYLVKRQKDKGKFWLDHVFKTHAEYLS